MDPVTIAATAGKLASTSWDTGQALFTFIQSAKVVDDTVRALQAEVRSFGNACTLVQSLLDGLSQLDKARITDPDGEPWTCLEDALQDSRNTVSQLREVIDSLKGSRSGFFAKGWRQTKMNMKRDDVTAYRSRIASHMQSVQMVTSTLNLKVNLLNLRTMDPQEIFRQMLELQKLFHRVLQLQSKKIRTPMTTSKDLPHASRDGTSANRYNATLINMADDVLSSASTVYTSSIAGGSVAGDHVNTNDIRAWLDNLQSSDIYSQAVPTASAQAGDDTIDFSRSLKEPAQTTSTVEEESVDASGSGNESRDPVIQAPVGPAPYEGLHDDRQSGYRRSVPDPELEAPVEKRSSDKRIDSFVLERPVQEILSSAAPVQHLNDKGHGFIGSQDDWDSYILTMPVVAVSHTVESDHNRRTSPPESGRYMTTEQAHAAITDACDAFYARKYSRARENLLKASSLLEQVPPEAFIRLYHIREIKYMLAACSFELDPRIEAEKNLLEFLHNATFSRVEFRWDLLHATHLLAVAQLSLGKLEAAHRSCMRALEGSRKAYGIADYTFMDSIVLMCYIRILWGDKLRLSGIFDERPMQIHQDVFLWISDTCVQLIEQLRNGKIGADQLLLHARNSKDRQAFSNQGGSFTNRIYPDLLEEVLDDLSEEVGVMIIALWEEYYPDRG
ncbi:hypothetical protein LTR37_001638 [Vermiconidia calcicola]|uniref:Uncharacterized protein n=1 Tax=Vermiconidia calcicola TaxID=1690605 RepID=A0ACC3NV89_9PEZI|nr:hypothetical protein LTR37_001638 [Vermiconidia calcicola]